MSSSHDDTDEESDCKQNHAHPERTRVKEGGQICPPAFLIFLIGFTDIPSKGQREEKSAQEIQDYSQPRENHGDNKVSELLHRQNTE